MTKSGEMGAKAAFCSSVNAFHITNLTQAASGDSRLLSKF
jgi:hypothetical protein